MSLKFINSGGKQYLVVNCFKFRENRTLANGNISWRCCVRDCNSWVKTDSGKTAIISDKHEHKHKTQYASTSITSSTPRARPVSTGSPHLPVDTTDTSPSSHLPVDTTDTSPSPSATTPFVELNKPSMENLECENILLKAEVATLKAEKRVILDHSIESDQRLLQYTDDVFNIGTTSIISSKICKQKEISTQTEVIDIAAGSIDTTKHLQDILILQQELQSATLKIKSLEAIISLTNVPCKKCGILQDETKNMIESIKILEIENNSLKQNIYDLESLNRSPASSSAIPLFNRFLPLSKNESTQTNLSTGPHKKSFNSKSKNNMEQRRINAKEPKLRYNSTSINVNKTTAIKFHNVSIIGDSHVRYLAETVRKGISPATRVTGICKPNAGLLQIAPTSDPPPEHCYVLLGGTNDVDAGRQDIIYDHFESVLKQCGMKSRVLVCPLFQRHDLPPNSSIHNTIARANHYLSSLCSRNERTELLDISSINRGHFTAHGLHLRASGKRLLSKIIVEKLSHLKPLPRHVEQKEATSDAKALHQSPTSGPYETYAEAAAQPSSQKNCSQNQLPVKSVVTSTCSSNRQSFLV